MLYGCETVICFLYALLNNSSIFSVVHRVIVCVLVLLSGQPVGAAPTREKEASLAPRQGVLWRRGGLEILHIRYSMLMTGFSMSSLAKLDVLLR